MGKGNPLCMPSLLDRPRNGASMFDGTSHSVGKRNFCGIFRVTIMNFFIFIVPITERRTKTMHNGNAARFRVDPSGAATCIDFILVHPSDARKPIEIAHIRYETGYGR